MAKIMISDSLNIGENEVQVTAIRAQGSGGQHVNKVSTAIHLRFDIRASSLDEEDKEMLLQYHDHRITSGGVIVIKAQQFRSQAKNKEDALHRLQALISVGTVAPKKRKMVKRPKASIQKRLPNKSQRSDLKKLRKNDWNE